MFNFVEQVEILRHDNREVLQELVDTFIVNKCIKRIEYYVNYNSSYITEKHHAYIYYNIPKAPTISVTGMVNASTAILHLTLASDMYLTVEEVGVYYNTTGIFTELSPKVTVPFVYGTQSVTIENVPSGSNYYFKPYFKCCLGTIYGEIFLAPKSILDTYLEEITDTYNELILDTY